MLFHHDNAPAHTSAIATAKLFVLHYEILPHPLDSSDLAPSDYFLFLDMKTWLEGKRFSSKEEIIAATNEYFEGFDENYFLEDIKKLEYHYNKFIQLKGDYVKKQIGIFVIKSVLHFKVTDLLNSPRIYSGIIIPVNVTGKYSKSSFKIRRWQRYCLHNLAPFRFSLYM